MRISKDILDLNIAEITQEEDLEKWKISIWFTGVNAQHALGALLQAINRIKSAKVRDR
jgi:hypothetical protein